MSNLDPRRLGIHSVVITLTVSSVGRLIQIVGVFDLKCSTATPEFTSRQTTISNIKIKAAVKVVAVVLVMDKMVATSSLLHPYQHVINTN